MILPNIVGSYWRIRHNPNAKVLDSWLFFTFFLRLMPNHCVRNFTRSCLRLAFCSTVSMFSWLASSLLTPKTLFYSSLLRSPAFYSCSLLSCPSKGFSLFCNSSTRLWYSSFIWFTRTDMNLRSSSKLLLESSGAIAEWALLGLPQWLPGRVKIRLRLFPVFPP